eukprot:4950226-Prymnesium_polylepis.1
MMGSCSHIYRGWQRTTSNRLNCGGEMGSGCVLCIAVCLCAVSAGGHPARSRSIGLDIARMALSAASPRPHGAPVDRRALIFGRRVTRNL